MNNITEDQQISIQNYKKIGIEFSFIDDVIKIYQKRLVNSYILNQKELHERAREIFPDAKIQPVVFSLDISAINVNWIERKMVEFGIKRKDLIKQLAFDENVLSHIFSGKKELTNIEKSALFYYFLCFELNKEFRNNATLDNPTT